MKTYRQLTQEQRYQISALQRIGRSQTEIAQELVVHKSTIGRELSRNTGARGYRPKQADEKASQDERMLRPGNVFRQRLGKWWKRRCAKIGVLNKFLAG